MIYLASDHRGWHLKNKLAEILQENFGVNNVVDCGDYVEDAGDDYVDFAAKACQNIESDNFASLNIAILKNKLLEYWPSFGIFLCGSGVGMGIVANKYKTIFAANCHNTRSTILARQHNNANVLVLESENNENVELTYQTLVKPFLQTSFDNEERHLERILKILKLKT